MRSTADVLEVGYNILLVSKWTSKIVRKYLACRLPDFRGTTIDMFYGKLDSKDSSSSILGSSDPIY